jgi:hypothetical protein
MDDVTLLLPPIFDEAAQAGVLEVQRRAATGGLRLRLEKCVAVAQLGRVFSEAERARLDALGIKWVDATTEEATRGFTLMGIPVGTDAYVHAQLRERLLEEESPLWRLAWQLVGMAREDFPAALRIFRGSFTKRFGYIARNVDPDIAAPWLGGYDGLCAWVLERLLQVRGSCSPADMREHLEQACAAGNAQRAANDGPLALVDFGPQGIGRSFGVPALPFRVGRLPQRAGGLGLPQLHLINRAAFMAQAVTTIPARLLHMLPHLHEPGGKVSDGAPLPPMLTAFRATLQFWQQAAASEEERQQRRANGVGTQYDEEGDVIVDDAPARRGPPQPRRSQCTQRDSQGDVIMGSVSGLGELQRQWESESEPDYDSEGNISSSAPRRPRQQPQPAFVPPSSLDKIIPDALLEWAERGPLTVDSFIRACVCAVAASPKNPISEELLRIAVMMGYIDRVVDLPEADPQEDGNGRRQSGGRERGGEERQEEPPKVQRALTNLVVQQQWRTLERDLRGSAEEGQVVLAQLHSQRGPGALAWQHCAPGRFSCAAAATMVLVSMCVDPWRVDGDSCPFCNTTRLGGPTSVHAMGCTKQHVRGVYGAHTAVVRCMLRQLRQHHVPWTTMEDASPFCVEDRRMDIVVAPGALQLASVEEYALKGVLIDHTVRCPTMHTYVRQAALKEGHATRQGEKAKRLRYEGRAGKNQSTFDQGRYVLVPFAQESFGRFGVDASKFLTVLASHSAACLGGDERVVMRRAAVFRRNIVMELSLSLAREMAERILAFVRCAAQLGRSRHPVSALLSLSSA